MRINYQPIGVIHTPFKSIENTPIQQAGASNVKGTIEILPQFVAGLKDLAGFSHIILLYHFHFVQGGHSSLHPSWILSHTAFSLPELLSVPTQLAFSSSG